MHRERETVRNLAYSKSVRKTLVNISKNLIIFSCINTLCMRFINLPISSENKKYRLQFFISGEYCLQEVVSTLKLDKTLED